MAKRRKPHRLVLGYLERISSKVFSDYPKEITALAGRQHGVYTLYKGDRLYYVGLATNLRNRIRHHLRDKHAKRWDRFSLYLVRHSDHIRELESLILRIADPTGNAVKGRLAHAENLRPALRERIREAHDHQLMSLLGPRARQPVKRRVKKKTVKETIASGDARRPPSLAPHVDSFFLIKREYKGRDLRATVRSDGTIKFDGKIYDSPFGAASAAAGRRANGWKFWRYRDEDGKWVPLEEIRKKKRSRKRG